MRISVLSGKGGTGKTTLSVNMFGLLPKATLIDTDTEEPNSHLFLQQKNTSEMGVYKKHPVVDHDKCSFCGECGNHCNFNAIIPTKKKVLVFDDLCHDCGMCELVCKSDAIRYQDKSIGVIVSSISEEQHFHYGKLNIGEVSGVRLIEHLHEQTKYDDFVITDCPPGVSCSTVAALKDTDYAVICAEPTPFGLSDMKMVVELLRKELIKFGVVVNKSGIGNQEIYRYLEEESIPLLENIPWTRDRARLYSEGKLIIHYDDEFKQKIHNIITKVMCDYHD